MQRYNNNNNKKYEVKRKTELKLLDRKGYSIRKWKSGAKKDADLDTFFLILCHIYFP